MSLLIGVFTFILILVSLFLVLVVLMQRAKSDGGVGAALGGGMTESTFGAETGNVLSKATINAAIAFFVISFGLYLGHIYQRSHARDSGATLPKIPGAVATPAPTAPAAALPAPTMPPPSKAAAPAATPAGTPAPAPTTPAAPTGGEKKP